MRSIVGVAPEVLQDEDDDSMIRLKKTDFLACEVAGERARALYLLDRIMHTWGITNAYSEMRKGSWRDPGELLSLDTVDLS
jgi:hypothetical protein